MDELVQHIEDRIRSLVQKNTDLHKHNSELNVSRRRLALENEHILAKHKTVASLVENTIARLKSIEGLI